MRGRFDLADASPNVRYWRKADITQTRSIDSTHPDSSMVTDAG